jgi:hypothetical protein
MQDTAAAAALYRFEFRGTIEIPTHVLTHHPRGTLKQALELCDEYGCQILLRDVENAEISRGWVRPNGQYSLT